MYLIPAWPVPFSTQAPCPNENGLHFRELLTSCRWHIDSGPLIRGKVGERLGETFRKLRPANMRSRSHQDDLKYIVVPTKTLRPHCAAGGTIDEKYQADARQKRLRLRTGATAACMRRLVV